MEVMVWEGWGAARRSWPVQTLGGKAWAGRWAIGKRKMVRDDLPPTA